MRVLICGSRDWTDWQAIKREIEALPRGTIIIEGEARGADRIARDLAKQRGLTVEPFPANWQRYGRSAGPIRNSEMLRIGRPDLVLAFHKNNSRGTRDMIEQAQAAGIECRIFFED